MKIVSKAIGPTHNKKDYRTMRFEYCYRDAANFKVRGYIALLGNLSPADREEIVAKLEGRELFVAEQIGVPALYGTLYNFSDGPISNDHCWHEFVAFSDFQHDTNNVEIWGTTEKLLSRFRSVKGWDVSRSPHIAI